MTVEAAYQATVDAINALLPGVDPFVLEKKTIARADLIALLAAVVTAVKSTKADRLKVTASVAAERLAIQNAAPVRNALKTFAQARYGKTAPELQQFGFVQKRTPKRKPEAKAAGVVKAKATRASLGTKGRQQKAKAKAAIATPAPATKS